MIGLNNGKLDVKFHDRIVSTKDKIEVKPGKCRYNFKCHMNAVHSATKKNETYLAMVVYMHNRKKDPIIHFINFDGKSFTDNTLGIWSVKHDYYLVRLIHKKDYMDIEKIFTQYREDIRASWSWWMRLTTNITF